MRSLGETATGNCYGKQIPRHTSRAAITVGAKMALLELDQDKLQHLCGQHLEELAGLPSSPRLLDEHGALPGAELWSPGNVERVVTAEAGLARDGAIHHALANIRHVASDAGGAAAWRPRPLFERGLALVHLVEGGHWRARWPAHLGVRRAYGVLVGVLHRDISVAHCTMRPGRSRSGWVVLCSGGPVRLLAGRQWHQEVGVIVVEGGDRPREAAGLLVRPGQRREEKGQ